MQEIKVFDSVRTTEDVRSGFTDRLIPKGTEGTIIESYENPEGYAIDLAIPDDSLVGGFAYENVILRPHQFEVIEE